MYSGLRDQRRWTYWEALDEQSRNHPDRRWIEMIHGPSLTFREAHDDALRAATFLAGHGVGRGDMVAVMLSNGLDLVRAWLAINRLGAVAVLLNNELTGSFLRHQLDLCGAAILITDGPRSSAIADVASQLKALRKQIIAGKASASATVLEAIDWEHWRSAEPYVGAMPAPQDIACVMYTSGTSGPAKAVQMPHAHCYLYGLGSIDCLQLTSDDSYYIVLPLFHANGLLMQLGATLLAGIRAVVRERFSASAWLEDVRRHRVTVSNTLGAVAAFIVARPPTGQDRDHRLRAILAAPLAPEHEAVFRERFGVRDMVSGFGMTEVNIPVWGRLGQSRPGAAGWVQDRHFDLIIANPDTDEEMPRGVLGEILVRPKIPFGFMAGYYGMPEKTVEAWRNLWFHTGDAGIMDETGLVTFVDRIKDCIRRRGENISATEIEAALGDIPGVAEIAAFAVPSGVKGGEDEIMLAVVGQTAHESLSEVVAAHARVKLPKFAQPRYLEILSELPKTATGKVQRARLRHRGVTPKTISME